MGQSKGAYGKKSTQTKEEQALNKQLFSLAGGQFNLGGIQNDPVYQQALKAIQGFLPGGEGANAITAEANRNFQQQTIPQILSAFGSGAKTSSALNQALAAGGQNLNSSLASQLAQMQLQAANQGLSAAQMPFQQGLQAAQTGLAKDKFAFTPKGTPFWQDATIAGIQAAGNYAKGGI